MGSSFITSEKNDDFILLRGRDLQDLLVEVENYFLEYREKINLPSNVTFGVEIEYEGVSRVKTNKFIDKNLKDWISKDDGSLQSGGEVTSPIMKDQVKYWRELKKVCEYLSKKGADTSHNAGGHIHIGANVLGYDVEAWRAFLKLYTVYENVIFRFVYGDKISGRRELLKYAPPTADFIYRLMPMINKAKSEHDIKNILLLLTKKRHVALNFDNVGFRKNTFEFRSPNASTNAVIWQNNINAVSKMLVSSKDKVLDEEFLDYKLEHEYFPYSENDYLYDVVNLKNVLEFVDLVFDNNLDKIYFLRQYLKNFQDNYGLSLAVKARRFVK